MMNASLEVKEQPAKTAIIRLAQPKGKQSTRLVRAESPLISYLLKTTPFERENTGPVILTPELGYNCHKTFRTLQELFMHIRPKEWVGENDTAIKNKNHLFSKKINRQFFEQVQLQAAKHKDSDSIKTQKAFGST